jgi:cytochrome P450
VTGEGTPSAGEPDVDPAILRAVGDVRRPERPLGNLPSLKHIPGKQGTLTGIANILGWATRGQAHLDTQAKRYGPIYRIQIGPNIYVAITDPAIGGQILRNSDGTWSTALGWLMILGGIADGPMDSPNTLDFGEHREVRRLLQPAFKGDALASYVDIANRHVTTATDRWLSEGHVTFKSEVRRLFARVAADVFLGIDDPDEAMKLDEAMTDFWGGAFALIKNERLSPAWRKARRQYRSLIEHFGEQVEARRASDGVDLFTRLCQTNEKVDWLDDEGLVRVLVGVMAAAFDTTSAAVTSMAYLLATHPDWQERLRAEANELTVNAVDYHQIKHLEQLEWVWKETLRLYPVAAHVPRIALREVAIGGYRIPAGGYVTVVLSNALRDPASFAEPHRFDPERFAPPRAEDKQNRASFMPFGAGHHACIGAQLSGLEAKAFWYHFLRKARIRLARPYEAHHAYRPVGIVSGDVSLVVDAA